MAPFGLLLLVPALAVWRVLMRDAGQQSPANATDIAIVGAVVPAASPAGSLGAVR